MKQRDANTIDFGGLGTGDPACDLVIAFTLMTADSRAAFRDALGVDDATWMRGRGWALATGLNAFTAYAAVNPRFAAQTHPADHPGPHRLISIFRDGPSVLPVGRFDCSGWWQPG